MRVLKSGLFRKWYVYVPLVVGFLLFVLFSFLHKSTVSAEGMQYFVAKNHPGGCSDSYPGTIDQPWCTIAKANAELNPGDTVYIRQGTYYEMINPARSGTQGNFITYTRYQNESVEINGSNRSRECVDLRDRDFINVDGLNIKDCLYFVRGGNAEAEPGFSNCIIQNNTMFSGEYGIHCLRGGCSYNKILNNTIELQSLDEIEANSNNPTIRLGFRTGPPSNNNLIEGNDISFTGSYGIVIENQNNVVRNNKIHDCGSKGISIYFFASTNVFEGNTIYHTGIGPDGKGKGINLFSGNNNIVRRNVVYDDWESLEGNLGESTLIGIDSRDDIGVSHNNHIYNNVLYGSDNWGVYIGHHPNPDFTTRNIFFKNNIIYKNSGYSVHFYSYCDNPMWPPYEGILFDHNLISTGVVGDDVVRFFCQAQSFTLEEAQSTYPEVFVGNLDGNPLFVNEGGRDFSLQDQSMAIDTGTYLTRTLEAGSGVEIQVEDAGYFFDGFDIVEGDQIQLQGQAQTARITNIDYDNNSITVDTPLNWTVGQGVSLAYHGAAPDMGAYEFDNGEPTPTFIDVPINHWAYETIETLYQAGYIAGCSTDPLMYCPDATMTRAESAVFIERGIQGADYLPDQPTEQIFTDVPLTEWFAKWATALWDDGYTAGCGTDPLIYCPLQGHTRAEGSVFFLRMMHGADYVPPEPAGLFGDVPIEAWYADWAEAAYEAGIIPACETEPDLLFCPEDPLDRAMAAYMMVQAKGLLTQVQDIQ
jgi:parallel beta-helix repeat protein